jgi:rhamnosyltransferase
VSENSNFRVAAGIVAFAPDPKMLRATIAKIMPHVRAVLVFVNGAMDQDLKEKLAQISGLELIDSSTNFGIGEALNIIVLNAALLGCSHVVLLDQDSRPERGLTDAIARVCQQLQDAGERPAAVGPVLVAPAGTQYKSPRYLSKRSTAVPGAKPVYFLPTSGTLVSIAAFRDIGPFRGDYFIDGLDLEWCFRAWAKGYSCWLATGVAMEHTVGEGAVGVLGFRTPRQKDFRLETYLRNTLYGFRLQHIPWWWKLRQAAYLAVQVLVIGIANGFRPSLMKRLARGFINGIRGRLGPPQGVPYT